MLYYSKVEWQWKENWQMDSLLDMRTVSPTPGMYVFTFHEIFILKRYTGIKIYKNKTKH